MSEKKNGSYKSRKQLYLASFIVCVVTAGLSATSVYASNDLAVESTSISSYEETEASSVSKEEQEISKNEISEGYYEESMLKTERQEFEKNTSTINPLTEQLLANGIFGECYWRVYRTDAEIILELSAGQLANFGSNTTSIPWNSYRSSITKLIILEGVKAPENASYMFSGYSQLVEIDGIEKLDCTNAQDMTLMFYNSPNLENLNLNDWNVEFVENMQGMFRGVKNLKNLVVDSWNTGRVQSMRAMFYECQSLTTLSIDTWDTSVVSDTTSMFYGASELTLLDLNSWRTTSIIHMTYMFGNMSELAVLNISDWDTRFVTDMAGMFMNTPKLTSLDVSNWDTRSLENMVAIFSSTGLQFLDLNQWNVSSVTNMRLAFSASRNLTNLYVDQWNTESVTNMEGMFFYCSGLSELDLNQWDTSSVINMGMMFQNASGLSDLKIGGWSVDKVQHMNLMFMNMDNLKELNLSNWNTERVIGMERMFANTNLMSLTLGENFRFRDNASLPEITAEGYTGQWVGETTATLFSSSSDFMNHYEGQADTYVWESKVMKITLPVRMLFYSDQDDITRLTSNLYQFSNSGNTTTKIEIVDLENILNVEKIQQLDFGDVELIRNGESVRTTNTPGTLAILSPETTITKKFYGNVQPLTDEFNPKFYLIFRFSFANEVE